MKVLVMMIATAISACAFTGCKKEESAPAPEAAIKSVINTGGEEPPVPPPPRKP